MDLPSQSLFTLRLPRAAVRGAVDLPYWVSILAGLPVALCLMILGVPDLEHGVAIFFRGLYTCAFILWLFPLAYLQRRLWESHLSWWLMSVILLGVSYCMSVSNNVAGMMLAMHFDPTRTLPWYRAFSGLDGCWLAFTSYFAVHAVLIYYVALARERIRTSDALALARDAQLRALRYQIHPHFLFNTLNAISALVVQERNREANRMIASLGDFLRATLESEDCHEHALADELALTENYLNIEKARLGSRLFIAMHIGPDVLQAQVPYLLLQPLMENAIRHGIAQRSMGGQIDLSINRVDDGLQVCLKNDESMGDVSAMKDHSCGVGLRNVMGRLTKLYAEQHTFSACSEESGQFSVQIVLPYRTVVSDAIDSAAIWHSLPSRAA